MLTLALAREAAAERARACSTPRESLAQRLDGAIMLLAPIASFSGETPSSCSVLWSSE